MDIKVNDVAKTQQVETKQAEKPHDDSFINDITGL